MEYSYNNIKDYVSMKIENRPKDKLSIINYQYTRKLFEIFKLLFPEEIFISLVKESMEYALHELIKEDGEKWKNKTITKNSYKWYYK